MFKLKISKKPDISSNPARGLVFSHTRSYYQITSCLPDLKAVKLSGDKEADFYLNIADFKRHTKDEIWNILTEEEVENLVKNNPRLCQYLISK